MGRPKKKAAPKGAAGASKSQVRKPPTTSAVPIPRAMIVAKQMSGTTPLLAFKRTKALQPQFVRPIRNLGMLHDHLVAQIAKRFIEAQSFTRNSHSIGPVQPMARDFGPGMGIRAVGRPNKVGGGAHSARGTGLSNCALIYAKAMTNPFGEFPEYPCVPANPPVPSQRWRAVTRGTFAAGTNGQGFILVAPYDPRNSQITIWTTTTGFVGTTYSKTVGATVLGSSRTSMPYSAGAFPGAGSPGVQGKLVSLGLRVRNIGQLVQIGGILLGTTVPSDTSLETLSFAQVQAYPGTCLVPQALTDQSEWSELIQRPTDVTDLDYLDTGVINVAGCLGFYYAGFSTNLFEYEIVEFWEFIGTAGSIQVPEIQESHGDEVGLGRVLEAVQEMPVSLLGRDIQKQTAEGIVDAFAHSDSTARTVEDLLGFVGLPMSAVSGMVSSLVKSFAL
jgi:hypothetical protein